MKLFEEHKDTTIRDSIVVSIPACHAGDRGSIPRLGALLFFLIKFLLEQGKGKVHSTIQFH